MVIVVFGFSTGGYYCDSEGISKPSGLCAAGYYCSSSAQTATPSDAVTGDYCRAGTLLVTIQL